MGILAAVATGINIGEAITNGVLKYSKSQYLGKISTLRGLFNELSNHLNTMEGLKERFKQIYVDGAADDILRELEKQISAVKNAMTQVNEQTAMWEAAISEMEETVGEQTNKVDTIHQLVSSLDIQD